MTRDTPGDTPWKGRFGALNGGSGVYRGTGRSQSRSGRPWASVVKPLLPTR